MGIAAETGRVANVTDWRELGNSSSGVSPTSCAPGGAYATFISGVAGGGYVPGALCLLSSLRAVGSACPLVIIHDDRGESVALPSPDLRRLQDSFGTEHVFALTGLMGRFPHLSNGMSCSCTRKYIPVL